MVNFTLQVIVTLVATLIGKLRRNKMEIIKRVTDSRKRTWECFADRCYYDMYCVRVEGDRDFNSQLSFHFCTVNEAFDFMNLIKDSH